MYFDINQFPKLNVKIPHRNWKTVLAQAFALILVAEPGDMISITGPSRIGKSRLISELMKLLCGDNDYRKSGIMPAVAVQADNTGPNGTFSTKAFVQRMLNAVEHPILSNKSRPIDDLFLYHKSDRKTEPSLKFALERALENRGTKYLFIDEAQHAKYALKASQAPHAVMDSWKCLAMAAQVVLVVVGAYPILDILRNASHLIGRKHQIEFPRYRLEDGDEHAFCEVVDSFGSLLNVDRSIGKLSNCADIIYEGSFGCIGLVKSWLTHAAVIGQLEDVPITKEILIRTMKSDSDRAVLWDEIAVGEKSLERSLFDGSETKSNQVTKNTRSQGKAFRRRPKRFTPGNRE